jgi:hypothetical protein
MLRLTTHIEWADNCGALESVATFLHSLEENQWFHLGSDCLEQRIVDRLVSERRMTRKIERRFNVTSRFENRKNDHILDTGRRFQVSAKVDFRRAFNPAFLTNDIRHRFCLQLPLRVLGTSA